MIALVLSLSLRQLLGQRRTLFLVLLALVPLLAALIYRIGNADLDAPEFAANVLLNGLVVQGLLPLTALIFGTAALGSEIEDGTITYLLSKPMARWRIVVGKLLASWTATTAVVLLSAVASGAVVLAGESEPRIVAGFAIALVAGALAYSALFLLLSLVTSRALFAGLGYAFIWEGVVTNFAPGVQRLSIREYTLGIADFIADTSRRNFDAELGFTFSVILMAVVCIGAAALAVRRLSGFELGESA